MEFLSFTHETCPWFPEEGTVNPASWERVGQQLCDRFTVEGHSKFPIPTFVLWNLIKESLDPSPEVSRLPPPSQGGLSQVLHKAVEGYEALKCSGAPSAPPVQDKQLPPPTPIMGKNFMMRSKNIRTLPKPPAPRTLIQTMSLPLWPTSLWPLLSCLVVRRHRRALVPQAAAPDLRQKCPLAPVPCLL